VSLAGNRSLLEDNKPSLFCLYFVFMVSMHSMLESLFDPPPTITKNQCRMCLYWYSFRFGSAHLVWYEEALSVCSVQARKASFVCLTLESQRTWNRRFQLLKSQVTTLSIGGAHIMAMSTLVALVAAVAAGPPRQFGSQPHRGRVAAMSRVSAPRMPPPPSNGSSAGGADAGACCNATA
jgi:hypothetical protein